MKKAKRYDQSFKEYAVDLIFQGKDVKKTAQKLNIPYSTLSQWKRERSIMEKRWEKFEEDKYNNQAEKERLDSEALAFLLLQSFIF